MTRRPALARWVTALLLCSCMATGWAADTAGPSQVAKADTQLWAEPINTAAGFDKASRAALLVYAQALLDMQTRSDAEMLAAFKIKSINRASVDKWLKTEIDATLTNYQRAASACSNADWTCAASPRTSAELLGKALGSTPPALARWREQLSEFSRAYLGEQLRLAALFPKISSEIDRFNDREWTGEQLPDRQFYLTFDDGPTAPGGATDDTLKMLERTHKTAVFFMLGQSLQTRLARSGAGGLAAQFKGQCVASHGWEHQSHAKWEQWQDSIVKTHKLLNEAFASPQVLPLFRPPYGQRKADSGAFFQAQGLRVALWNLDSQDWNSRVTPDDIFNRMLTLMLIKRHGVLLFHDVHPKAHLALPKLFDQLGSAVEWGECHQLSKL